MFSPRSIIRQYPIQRHNQYQSNRQDVHLLLLLAVHIPLVHNQFKTFLGIHHTPHQKVPRDHQRMLVEAILLRITITVSKHNISGGEELRLPLLLQIGTEQRILLLLLAAHIPLELYPFPTVLGNHHTPPQKVPGGHQRMLVENILLKITKTVSKHSISGGVEPMLPLLLQI